MATGFSNGAGERCRHQPGDEGRHEKVHPCREVPTDQVRPRPHEGLGAEQYEGLKRRRFSS
ncbi:hypothetical protein GCM10023238_17110 [Streptomyces heliomycini]